MGNKTIIFIVLAVIIGLIGFMIYKSIIKINHKKEVTEQLATIPELQVVVIDPNKNMGWKNTANPVIILFFNSECEHCQYEAKAIQERLEAFENVDLLFVSEEVEGKIRAFSKEYKLDNKPNIWWLKMEAKDVYNSFGNIGVPHIWVYTKEGKLVKEFRGETKVEALLECL